MPNVSELAAKPGLDELVNGVRSTFEDAVGKELVADAVQADKTVLDKNTLFAQMRASFVSSVMWLALLKHSYYGESPLEQLMGVGLAKIQFAGDSAGGVDAHLLPGPGHIDDQLKQIKLVAELKAYRGELMLRTEHAEEAGGMAAVVGYHTGTLNKYIIRVNNCVGPDCNGRELELVKHNAPRVKVIAGPRTALDTMQEFVGRRTFIPVSNHWFHHSSLRPVGEEFGRYVAQEGFMGKPSEIIEHVSYVTGGVVPVEELANDLAEGIWKPVYFYTLRGPSVHGAAHKNGFNDAIVFNQEISNWLSISGAVVPHLVTDYESLAGVKKWLMSVIYEGVKQGKPKPSRQTETPPPLQRRTPYQGPSRLPDPVSS